MRATILALLLGFSVSGFATRPSEKRCVDYLIEAQKLLQNEDSLLHSTVEGTFRDPIFMSLRLMDQHGASVPLAARAFFTQLGQATLAHYLLRQDTVPPNLEGLARLAGTSPGEVVACFDRARRDGELLSYFARVHAVFAALDLPPELANPVWMNPYLIPLLYHLARFETEKVIVPMQGLMGAVPPRFRESLIGEMAQIMRVRPGIVALVNALVEGKETSAPADEILLHNRHVASGQALIAAYLENQTFGDDPAQANGKVIAFWRKHFAFPVPIQGTTMLFSEIALQTAGRSFQTAMIYAAKGYPQSSLLLRRRTAAMLRQQGLVIDDATQARLDHLYDTLADTAEARALTWNQFVLGQGASPEALLVHYANAPDMPRESFDGMPVSVFRGRPQQLAMAKAVLEFTFSQPNDRFLELGYGTPLSQVLLPGFVPQAQFDGLDLIYPNDDAVRILGPIGGRLFQGNAPSDTKVAAAVAARAPYNAIYAVDVFRTSYGGFGKDLELGVSNAEYLRWIYDQLGDGGTFLAMNDNEAPFTFTPEECRAAGFTVVRWAARRPLPEAQRALFSPRPPKVGDMLLFVLRKGREPSWLLK